MKKLILGTLLAAAAAAPAYAQQTMYLVKDNHVIASYDVDAVDYVTFNPGDDIETSPIWLDVVNVGKNTVTYKVNTADPTTTYLHNLVSRYDLNLYALSYYDDEFDNLPEGTKRILFETFLESGYVAQGDKEFTMTDYEDDGTGGGLYESRFSVRAGVTYYLLAAPANIQTEEIDGANLVAEVVKTQDAGQSALPLSFSCVSAENEVATFDLTGTSTDFKYLITCLLSKSVADLYTSLYGADFIINTWGQAWTVEDLMSNSRWNVYESGEYTMLVRGVDADGDIRDTRCDFTYTASASESGPVISIFSKSKENGKVSINFEIAPSNVDEAYVYLDTENNVDDLLNDGWELYEIASRSSAIDITNEINTMGEYTFSQEITSEQWQTLLIYAKDKEANRTICRINFDMWPDSQWDINNPVGGSRSAAPAKKGFKTKSLRPLKRL